MLKKLIFIGSVFLIDQIAKYGFVEAQISRVNYYPYPVFLSLIALLITTYFYLKVKNDLLRWGLLFLFAGGLSNLYDYVVFHGARDYLLIGSMYFNLADVAIVVGALIILLYLPLSFSKERVG